jgi:hypothetical protein
VTSPENQRTEDPADQEPVPRLPRGSGFKLSTAELIRIAMFVALLLAVIVLRKPCSDGVAGFVDSFSPPDAGVAPQVLPPGEVIDLRNQSPEELRREIERIREGRAAEPEQAGADPDPAGAARDPEPAGSAPAGTETDEPSPPAAE